VKNQKLNSALRAECAKGLFVSNFLISRTCVACADEVSTLFT
jgi:hypothetical protein